MCHYILADAVFSDLDQDFMSDVRGFAKDIFTHSFQDSTDKKETTPSAAADGGATADSVKINFSEFAVANTAVSVQLVLWSLTEESGIFNILTATSLVNHLLC